MAISVVEPTPLPQTSSSVDGPVSHPSEKTSLTSRPEPGRFSRALALLWRYCLGVLACQNPLTAILVVGWTYRLAQRAAVKAWWRRSPLRQPGVPFRQCMREIETLAPLAPYPHTLRGGRTAESRPRWRRPLHRALGGLVENFRLGVKALFNTWTLTLIPGLIMLFSWYAGWNNSFYKGYELAAVGPASGSLGVGLFIAVMFYLPLAQARQAVIGHGKPFYRFRENRQLIRLRWHWLALLALGYAALGGVVMIMSALLSFIPQIHPALLQASAPEQLSFLQRYFLACGILILPAYILLRCWAARIYAGAVLEAHDRGLLSLQQLHPFEREVFSRLELNVSTPRPPSRFLRPHHKQWLLSLPGRVVTGILAVFLWFAFASEIYIAQFANYQHAARWLNHPLVQLPWFHHIPHHLKTAAAQETP